MDIRFVWFEPAAALSDDQVAGMDDAQYRAYWSIIFYLYCNGGKCEKNMRKFASLSYYPEPENYENKVWKKISRKFSEKNGFISHKRVTKELAAAKKLLQAKRKGGLTRAAQQTGLQQHSRQDSSSRQAGNGKVSKGKVSNKKKEYSGNSIEFQLSELLLTLINKRNPNFKKPDLQKWAIHIDRMVQIDKRAAAEIERIIRWCQDDDFWQNNILSTKKLRTQYDQLKMKMGKANGRTGKIGSSAGKAEPFVR